MKIFNILQKYYAEVQIEQFEMVLQLTAEELTIFRNKYEMCQFKMLYNIPEFFPEGNVADCLRNLLSDKSTYMDMFNYIVCSYPEVRKVAEGIFPAFTYV